MTLCIFFFFKLCLPNYRKNVFLNCSRIKREKYLSEFLGWVIIIYNWTNVRKVSTAAPSADRQLDIRFKTPNSTFRIVTQDNDLMIKVLVNEFNGIVKGSSIQAHLSAQAHWCLFNTDKPNQRFILKPCWADLSRMEHII